MKDALAGLFGLICAMAGLFLILACFLVVAFGITKFAEVLF